MTYRASQARDQLSKISSVNRIISLHLKGIVHPKFLLNAMLFQTTMTFFLPYNTKGEFLKNILANLFNIMKLKDLGCQASKLQKEKRHNEKYHKSGTYNLCAIFHIF